MKDTDKGNMKQETPCDVINQRNNASYSKPTMSEIENQYHIASCNCDFQILNNILSKNPSLVDVRSPFNGYTALHFACKFGRTDVIRSLVGNYKANVNLITSYNGKTPLHIAVEFKQEEAIRILLSQYNADKSIRDYSGKLPADIVDKSDNNESIMKLVGPPTTLLIARPTKGLKKSFQSLSTNVTPESLSKSFFSFRKGGDNSSHHLAPNTQLREGGSSLPHALHTLDVNSIKKSLSFMSNKSLVKHNHNANRSSMINKDDDVARQ